MSTTNGGCALVFQVRNHHSAACGTPPHMDDLRPNQYLGYLPIPAFPTKEIVRSLRRGGVKASVERGGRRLGAGRPPAYREPLVRKTVTLPVSYVGATNDVRGR